GHHRAGARPCGRPGGRRPPGAGEPRPDPDAGVRPGGAGLVGQAAAAVAGAALVGADQPQWLACQWLLGAAVLGGAAAGVATWLAVRTALAPVHRTRLAATALLPGQRLPVAAARDEVRAMA